MILAKKGYTAPAIAVSLGLSRRVCQQWVYRYNASGLEGLEDRRGRAPRASLSPEQQQQICKRIEAGPRATDDACTLRGKDVQRVLAEELGVLRSLAIVYHLLHRLGYSCVRPRPRHRGADPQKQNEFVKELPSRLAGIAAAHPDKRLRIYFEDEPRFGQQGIVTTVWTKRGTRPAAVRQTEHSYVWVLGAVCPETGHAEGPLSPRLNTKLVNAFREQFARTIPAEEHAVLL